MQVCKEEAKTVTLVSVFIDVRYQTELYNDVFMIIKHLHSVLTPFL